ncbi:hypothetical protein ILUMI_09644 [Ignelater luminosus]|uniref:Mitochondrial import inner membrane translocase subunit TIM50 n=1 Tax=Ignelater luminosus TaxID=2038154 RepID=A0A8K0D8Q7_IGNLU|nr:hypothetical protein ILUMI_09644 [Ignelater luminosus]
MSRVFFKSSVKVLDKILKLNSRKLIDRTNRLVIVPFPYFCNARAFCTEQKPKKDLKHAVTSLIVPESLQDEDQVNEETEARLAREAAWRKMKYTLIFMGISFFCFGSYLILEFGKPPVAGDGTIMRDEFSSMPTWMQYLYRTLREVDYYKRLIKEPSREKLLPDELMYPYFQPKYTLVLELTDVLVHPDWTYQTGWRFKKRPGIDHFLDTLSGSYEIVVYTAEQGMTVFPIIEALDPKNLITYKLVRDATHFVDGHHVKNLDKLNRNLKKVIVVDWNQDSVKFHPENMFHISRWTGNDDDTTLIDLTAFLMTVANSEVEDVRDVLNYYNQFDDGLAAFREKQRFLLEQQEAEEKIKTQENPLTARNWTPKLLNKPIV